MSVNEIRRENNGADIYYNAYAGGVLIDNLRAVQEAVKASTYTRKLTGHITMNGHEFIVRAESDCEAVLKGYFDQMAKERAAFKASPAGIASAAKETAEIMEYQKMHDDAFAMLQGVARLTYANKDQPTGKHAACVFACLQVIVRTGDRVGVKSQPIELKALLEGFGYKAGEWVGPKSAIDTRQKMRAYVAGQVLSFLSTSGKCIHPMIAHWIEEKKLNEEGDECVST